MVDDSLLFMGEFDVAIDEKNRVMIPARWKSYVDMEMILCQGFEGALELRNRDTFKNYVKFMTSGKTKLQDVRRIRRWLIGGSREVKLDKWHRFVIPTGLEKNFKDSVIMRGLGDYVEIWEKETFRKWAEDQNNSLEAATISLTANSGSLGID